MGFAIRSSKSMYALQGLGNAWDPSSNVANLSEEERHHSSNLLSPSGHISASSLPRKYWLEVGASPDLIA